MHSRRILAYWREVAEAFVKRGLRYKYPINKVKTRKGKNRKTVNLNQRSLKRKAYLWVVIAKKVRKFFEKNILFITNYFFPWNMDFYKKWYYFKIIFHSCRYCLLIRANAIVFWKLALLLIILKFASYTQHYPENLLKLKYLRW